RCAATAALKIVRRKQNCRAEIQVRECKVQSAGVRSSKCGSAKFKVILSVTSVISVANYKKSLKSL
ncbi:MAG TPA: hypothetical protein PKM80_00930, partial [Candidatus Cloacimonas sp.]|nr:hypothetical protein [Candidatus Cloacimonas sp.]